MIMQKIRNKLGGGRQYPLIFGLSTTCVRQWYKARHRGCSCLGTAAMACFWLPFSVPSSAEKAYWDHYAQAREVLCQ